MRRTQNAIGGIRAGVLGVTAAAISIATSAMTEPVRAQDAAPAASHPKTKATKAKPAATPGPAQDPAQGPTKDPAASLAAYSAGITAYQANKYDAAVASLSNAINGGLAANLIPKALYYRGAAYEKQGQSGQAISDLNSALWFKPGLDDNERANAMTSRTSAYTAAGMPVPGPTPRQNELAANADKVSETGSLPPAQKQASGLGGFFGDMFGSATPAAAPKPPTTPTSQPQAALPMRVAANEAEVLPWAAKGGVATSAAPPSQLQPEPVAITPSAIPAKKPMRPAAIMSKRGFRIQVAAVKSRDEASAVISKLQNLGGAVAATPATVDETKFGTMGTFFRVRLGPFVSAAATKAPCATLKASGLDCLVTAK